MSLQRGATADPVELATRVASGDLRAMSRLLSSIEGEEEHVQAALDTIYCRAGRAHVIGVTGVPGSGKSTLVARIAAEFRRRGITVGIIAIDPSSALSGGAILGDRVRMAEVASDSGVFIRSMATRGAQGGLARTTLEAVDVLDAAGFGIVIVETVGVGQDEFEISYAAHTTVVISVPGLGDAVQAIKAGLLEMADIHVVNKADRPDADRTLSDIKGMLAMVAPRHTGGWPVPVLATIAETGSGVAELASVLEQHRGYLRDSGEEARRRATSSELRIWRAVEEIAVRTIRDEIPENTRARLFEQVCARQMSPRSAAKQLIDELRP